MPPQGAGMCQGGRVPWVGSAAGGVWGLCWQWGWQRVPVPVVLVLFLGALWSVSAEGNAPRIPGTGGFVAQLLARWVCVLVALRSSKCLSAGWAVPAGAGVIHKGPAHQVE